MSSVDSFNSSEPDLLCTVEPIMRISTSYFEIFFGIFYSQQLITVSTEFVPPNIVVIMADDMGFDDVSFRGNNEFLTPNIDALAYHGKVLNHLYAAPMCTPTRASFLSGRYPIHTGSQHNVMFNEEPWDMLENQMTLAEILQNNGYSTNLVGKWHLGMGSREYTPTFKGFDYHYGYWGPYIDYYEKRVRQPSNFSMGYDFRKNLELECTPPNTYVTDLLTDEAERIILQRNNSLQPLFLFLSHMAPHSANPENPLQAPQEKIDKFSYIPDIRRRTYAAMVSLLDESVGRIVRALDIAQILSNTILIFYSDNGAPTRGLLLNTGSNWPFRGQKNSPWEGGVRVAGAIWSPLLPHCNGVFEEPIYVGDWLPTLAAASNINLELNLDGINMWPDLTTCQTNTNIFNRRNREILHVMDDMWQLTSYMIGQYKYIQGTTVNGTFDGFLSRRDENIIDPRTEFYGQLILDTITSRSLQRYESTPMTFERIQILRAQNKVECGAPGPNCDPLRGDCLFNIWQDPCERNNLASQTEMQDILQSIRLRLAELRSTAIRPKTGGVMLDFDPALHNCMWANYLEETPTEYILNCDYYSPPCQEFNIIG
ncbi:arylsulfatase B-like [Stomoxys calcitrans]|uniref:arylsulfatase B-like n=1 Tax=Stomoxys calcitrans TaxID=35570 RepID=UPI0027E33D3D|nr:arylsulfatase B-like [Stomoxys calcitrans]